MLLIYKDKENVDFMRLDSEAAIVEILPYVGTLDQAYRIVGQANRKLRDIWENNMIMFDKIIQKRRTIKTLYISFGEKYIEMLNEMPGLYTVFELEPLKISTKENYELLNKLIKNYCLSKNAQI